MYWDHFFPKLCCLFLIKWYDMFVKEYLIGEGL